MSLYALPGSPIGWLLVFIVGFQVALIGGGLTYLWWLFVGEPRHRRRH